MKHVVTLIWLAIGLTTWGQEITNDVAQSRPVYRYLFLVDTSSAMSRQKDLTMDTVSKVILSGVGGRIHSGEFWNIWTFDDQLHTNVFPPQMWELRQPPDVAERAYRFLRDQGFKKKKGPLDKWLAVLADEARLSGALTVLLFTDGSELMKGTPFDEPINEIFSQHADGMRKAKKPFVVVLVAQDGKFVAQAVSPGGAPIYIPRPAKTIAANEPPERGTNAAPARADSEPQPTANARDTTTATAAPQKKPLTVEEIAQALRQTQKPPTNTIAAAPAPLILRGAASNPAVPNSSSNLAAATAAPIPKPALLESGKASRQIASESVSNSPSVKAPPPPSRATPARAAENAPSDREQPAPSETIVQRASENDGGSITAAKTTADDTREISAPATAPPQTADLLQAEPASAARKYLAAAAALLLVALALAWLYIRSIRYVPRPSLISQSMEKEKK